MSTILSKPRAAETNKNPLINLRREMEDLFTRFWDGSPVEIFNQRYAPSVDLAETDNAYEVRMDLPGLQAKDIDVQVRGNTVTFSGTRKEEKSDKGTNYLRIERSSGVFSRTFTLPGTIKEDEVAADYTNGVLTVVLPKSEQERAHKVAVKG